MSDITDALTGFDQMRAEIDRLRKREAELLAAGDRLESQLCEAARERDRLRLTDEEREAVETAANHLDGGGWSSATLRSLLERMK